METALFGLTMHESPPLKQETLEQLLLRFEEHVLALRQSLVNAAAERALTSWEYALSGEAMLPIRCSAEGLPPGAFYRGIELEAKCQIDLCGVPKNTQKKQPLQLEIFLRFFEAQKARLLQYIQPLNQPDTRRPSSHACDEAMVQASQMSRGLGVWALLADKYQQAYDDNHSDLDENGHWHPHWPSPPLQEWAPAERRIFETMLAWEPLLNRLISAWNGNALHVFMSSALELTGRIQQNTSPDLIEGEPFRERGAIRWQVDTWRLNNRPFTPRPILHLRFKRLREKIAKTMPTAERSANVMSDIRFFINMLQQGVCQLAIEPVFQERSLGGRPIIRGKVRNHRWLLEPRSIFKQANLLCNRFYTRESQGHRTFFLELCQFQRWLQCQPATDSSMAMLIKLGQKGRIAWEENRLEHFNQSILSIARELLTRAGLSLPDGIEF